MTRPRSMPEIPSYVGWAAVLTIGCNLVGGAIALWFAAQVHARLRAGDVEGARRASGYARLACLGTVLLGAATLAGGWTFRVALGLVGG